MEIDDSAHYKSVLINVGQDEIIYKSNSIRCHLYTSSSALSNFYFNFKKSLHSTLYIQQYFYKKQMQAKAARVKKLIVHVTGRWTCRQYEIIHVMSVVNELKCKKSDY